MTPAEPSYLRTAIPECFNATEAQENDFKLNFMTMIEVLKKEMGKKNP